MRPSNFDESPGEGADVRRAIRDVGDPDDDTFYCFDVRGTALEIMEVPFDEEGTRAVAGLIIDAVRSAIPRGFRGEEFVGAMLRALPREFLDEARWIARAAYFRHIRDVLTEAWACVVSEDHRHDGHGKCTLQGEVRRAPDSEGRLVASLEEISVELKTGEMIPLSYHERADGQFDWQIRTRTGSTIWGTSPGLLEAIEAALASH